MNMFVHEMKAYAKSTIIWTCSLIAVLVLFMSMYPAFTQDVEAIRRLLQGIPEVVKKSFSLDIDNFFSLPGFYSFLLTYVILFGSIQAMNLGISALSKEISGKTADFLFSKPVSRARVLTAKFTAVLASLIITNAIYIAAAVVMANLVKTGQFDMKVFLMISVTVLFVQLIFAALGIVISVLVPRIKSVIPISLSTVFGFFLLNVVSTLIGEKAARYLIPFLYYDSMYIIQNASYEQQFIIVEAVFVILAVAAGYVIHVRKDIRAA